MMIETPASVRTEHEKLHGRLADLTKLGGRIGEAAQEVARLLHPHFVKEEKLAFPPLGLLGPLSRGEMNATMGEMLPIVDMLRSELPQMLAEHRIILDALGRLAEAGGTEKRPQASEFAEDLTAHARYEEEVAYPAALVVGSYLKLLLHAQAE